MLLIDFSQVAISSLLAQDEAKKEDGITVSLIKHVVFSAIKGHKKRFGNQYGDVVICCDSRSYWRKDVFPQYKGLRKKDREKSTIDWKTVFDCLRSITEDLRENFIYPIIEVDKAEGDDVIATLVRAHPNEHHIIVSSDKDFTQLVTPTVSLYRPTQDELIAHVDNVEFRKSRNSKVRRVSDFDIHEYMKEHVLKGDKGDGVPNVLSHDNFLIEASETTGMRQKAITKKLKEETFADFDNIPEEHKKNFERNKTLVDLSMIPDYIQESILEAFNTHEVKGDRNKMMNYFMQNRMKLLLKELSEF